jgi:hypothetical protein
VDCFGLCQAAGEVGDSAPEPLGVRTMRLGSGSGEGLKGLPIEGETAARALLNIEGDRMGEQRDRVVKLAGQHTHIGQRCRRAC